MRVRTPASYDATAARDRADRRLPGEPGTEREVERATLLQALEGNDFVLVDTIDLTPRRSRDLDGKPPANRAGTVRLDVDVLAGDDAVVLLEREGVYSWHLPLNPAERTRSIDLAPRTARFEIVVQPAPPARRTRRAPAPTEDEGARSRGLFSDIVHGAAQALVFRFAAPIIVEKAIERLESAVRPGLVHVTGNDVTAWKPFSTLDELGLPTDRPVRILLLVHGTFSSTVGAFAAMGMVPGAETFLPTVISAYDAVIGFDHKTLSLDPTANAQDLLDRLSKHHPQSELVIDVITHSRGGLVTRSLVEVLLPQSGWKATVDSIVFVACTNAGTHLADPKRWSDLVDLYTNLAMVAAAGLSAVPGAAPVVAVVGALVRGIGAFVKYLVSYAAEGDEVPGLAAMVLDGPFVTELNGPQPGEPKPGTSWYVVSSNFHVSLFDDHHNPPEFPKELVVKLAEGFIDQIFKDDNDLVVDTFSMSAIGLPEGGGFVRDTLALGTNDVVYHTNYFGQMRVLSAISGWLPLGLGAGGDDAEVPAWMTDLESTATGGEPPEAEPPPEPSPEPPQTNGGGDALGEGGDRGLESTGGGPATSPTPPPTTGPGPETPAPEPTPAKLAAEMPSNVVPGTEFTVRVRLARGDLAPTEGTTHVESDVAVDAARPISVQVIGKDNVAMVDVTTKEFGLPSGEWASELAFRGKALEAGPVVVLVLLRQGRVHIADVRLESTASAATVLATSAVTATVHPGIDAPELDGLPCIDIVETRRPGGERVYSYAVRLEAGGPAKVFESAPVIGRDEFVRARITEVEDILRDPSMSDARRLKHLQDIGTLLFDQFFPPAMQDHLWKNREAMNDLIVYTDEPVVPWELVHLKPSKGKRGTEVRFLAQGGLVRWQLGSFPPKRMRVRAGRARSICPHYVNPEIDNRAGLLERSFLAERFGAKDVTATPAGVEKALRGGGFDLLHFSGHGGARSDDIAEAAVLLKGRKRAGTIEEQYLRVSTVSENLDWADPRVGGPIVVLNACQTGRGGELFTTVGGFAKAFLDAGASAFVSCLWSVHEQPARAFVEKLYEELLAGTPMGAASAAARAAAREAGDPTWLAYVVYARPDAVLERD